MGWAEKTNMAVAKSLIGRRFRLEFSGHKFERKGTRFRTEVRAGFATFFGVYYLSQYIDSLEYWWHMRTAAISALSSFAMEVFANMPIALAPGMGMNAYFSYQVVGFHGRGSVSYQLALTAVFVEGLIFVVLSLLGIRQLLARSIPASLKIASGAGIGLYLALIGLTYDAGIGAITGGISDPLELAGCVPGLRDSVTGFCTAGKMRNPTMWLGTVCGGLFTAFLMMYRVKGALCIGIILVSAISWPRNTPVTAFPNSAAGDANFEFFRRIVAFQPLKHVLGVQSWHIAGAQTKDFMIALVTFLYVDILDCTGTLYSMARFGGVIDEDTQDFEGSAVAYLVDAFSISVGSFLGCPPVTAYIESVAGVSEGGATGLTACITGICFVISLSFAPVFASIPPWATGCTLVLVGAMMAQAAVDINWRYIGDSVPAFLTLAIMPFTYSIAYGLIVGILSYIILNTSARLVSWATNGRIIPYDYNQSDYRTPRPAGGFLPGWLKRLARGKRDFWREYDYDEQIEEGQRHHDSLPQSDQYIASESLERTASASPIWQTPEMTNLTTPVMARLHDTISITKTPLSRSFTTEKH